MQPKEEMKSLGSTSPSPIIRQRGQRSLSSSLFSKPNSCARHAEAAQIKPTKQIVSLSAFLDRKVGKTAASCGGGPPTREKRCSFSSVGFGRSGDGRSGAGTLVDGSVFRQLNHVVMMRDGAIQVSDAAVTDEFDGHTDDDGRESKKRSNPFSRCPGDDESRPAAKLLVVLGDDPTPRQKRRRKCYDDRKPNLIFNHYANGSGLWDCDREGIDSEEVGCTEPWEGMGSTTLGGLEWH